MRIPLALFATLLLLSVGSGATASTSTAPLNGLIAVRGAEGIYVVDPQAGSSQLVPKTDELTEPAWSPDGTLLAVSSLDQESSDLYTMKPDGTARTLVLRNAYSPSWSPDGKQLVVARDACAAPYSCSEDGGGTNRLAVVDVDGTDVRLLPLAADYIGQPKWSPDGKSIAYMDADRIQIVSPGGDSIRSVPATAASISWSPDSSKLAVYRYDQTKDGGQLVIVLLDLPSGKQTLLPGKHLGAEYPAWAPEGDQLAFLSVSPTATPVPSTCGEHSALHLWAMSPDGTNADELVKGEYYGPVSWARAVETDATPEATPPQPKVPPPVANPEAVKEPTPPKPTPAPARKLSTAAADGHIAVRGENAIYLVDQDNGTARKVPGTAAMTAPAWSPDAKLLAVEQEGGVYTIRPDGSDAQLVLENASSPSWSTDGDRIYAVRGECATPCEPEDDEANVLVSVRPDGKDAQRVDFEDIEAYAGRDFPWATDGNSIGFFADESPSSPGSFDSAAATWSPDGTRLAFVGAVGPAEDESAANPGPIGLWVVSAEGGTPQLLLQGASGRPSWST